MKAFPLQWPQGRTRTRKPQRSRFDVTLSRATEAALKEIRLMGGCNPVISSNLELRRDGLPYMNRPQPTDKGIAVYFTRGNKPLCFACD